MGQYADLTFNDKNSIKRWLQRKRLSSALKMCESIKESPKTVCDFGSGDGELCKLLAIRYPGSNIVCYEPSPNLMGEARLNLSEIPSIRFLSDAKAIARKSVDIVLCLEVFEHLPPNETHAALATIAGMLRSGGVAVIGVPVEIGIPALYKGAFRMFRRYGAFDAQIENVLMACVGHPPEREVSETSGLPFYYSHNGFDFRHLRESLSNHLNLCEVASSPFAVAPWLMPEIYYLAQKQN